MKDSKRKRGWTKKPESKPAIKHDIGFEPKLIFHASSEPLPLPTQPAAQEAVEVVSEPPPITFKDILAKLNPWRFMFGTQENFSPWRVVLGTAIVLIGTLCLVNFAWPHLVQLVSRLF